MNASISYRNVIALGMHLVFIVAFVPYMTKVTDFTLLIAPLTLICNTISMERLSVIGFIGRNVVRMQTRNRLVITRFAFWIHNIWF